MKSIPVVWVAICVPVFLYVATSRSTEMKATEEFNGATPLQWSARMADSQMKRLDGRLAWNPTGHGGKWDYSAGLFTLSLLKLNERIPCPACVAFATNAIGSFISPDGSIQDYAPGEYQLDAVNPGKTVIALYQLTGAKRYAKAAALLEAQLTVQPRTPDGGFWHKQRYTNQMWLDGLYMATPFYAEYTRVFGGPSANYDDVARQFALVKKHLYDRKSGLYYHGWDAKRIQAWANPVTGASSNFWGRAVGWYAMALVDTLDYLPTNHPARQQIIGQMKDLSKALVKYQDKGSGVWWQVMDKGDMKDNYPEATASTMFVYALAKAVNDGKLSNGYIPAIVKGYQGILNEFIRTNGTAGISLVQCCQVAGLGFASARGKPRDGSFAYYVSEPVVENDMKGTGPFILAGIEVQKLLDEHTRPLPH